MARQKTVIVNDVEYTLQSANFSWYTNLTCVHPSSVIKYDVIPAL